ncbi:MAG: phosphatidylglycerophosphatase A family protein [Terriglobales bacterium]
MPGRYSIAVATAFPRTGSAFEKLKHLVAIGGPIGFIPWVPATFASLATAAVCWAWPPHWRVVLILAGVVFALGGYCASTSERLLATQDPRNVVIDEVCVQLLTFLFVAPAGWLPTLAGFALFRLFDVTKPFPARRLERLPGGWGIMADDVAAGLYAAVVLWLLTRV